MLTEEYQSKLLEYLNSNSTLQDLLYNIDMLPEQATSDIMRHYIFGMIEMYELIIKLQKVGYETN
jgi:hypothetical protein